MRALARLVTIVVAVLGSVPTLFAAPRVVLVEHYTNYN